MKHYKIHNKLQYKTIYNRVRAWNRIQDRSIRISVVAHEILIFNYDKWEYEYFTTWKGKDELVAYINKAKNIPKSWLYNGWETKDIPTLDKQVASVL